MSIGESVDSLLIVGNNDQKLAALLKKMGYGLVTGESGQALPEILSGNVIDLILIDSSLEQNWLELCSFFRAEEATSTVPIVCLASDAKQIEEAKHSIERIEFVDLPYSAGSVVSKIAIQLRLRKLAGADNHNARLGEINAALRDLNDKFAKQIQEAQQIQETLLPTSLPADERFELAAAYQPLDGVGGDWYDVQKGPTGKISVQIADVTGHGLSAAFICAMTKLARSAATDKENPDELLQKMNSLMSPVLPEGRFVTGCSYLFDPATGLLKFARAGHPPALLLNRPEGKVRQLRAPGLALGFLEDAEYVSEEYQMEPNDMVLIYTDGIPEAQNMASTMYNTDRMEKIMLESAPEAAAAEILQRIFEDFGSWREGRILKDDVTAILLKRVK